MSNEVVTHPDEFNHVLSAKECRRLALEEVQSIEFFKVWSNSYICRLIMQNSDGTISAHALSPGLAFLLMHMIYLQSI
jgi:hypothetical protein